jgi:hypothetical protein
VRGCLMRFVVGGYGGGMSEAMAKVVQVLTHYLYTRIQPLVIHNVYAMIP